jgi:hypothetical protein
MGLMIHVSVFLTRLAFVNRVWYIRLDGTHKEKEDEFLP